MTPACRSWDGTPLASNRPAGGKLWSYAPSRVAAPVLAAAAFCVIAALVSVGAFTGVDQLAVDSLMPGLTVGGRPSIGSVFLPDFTHGRSWEKVAGVWMYPASVPISGLAIFASAAVLYRRGCRIAPAGWCGAWICANAVELLGRHVVRRPALSMSVGGRHVVGFEETFPSGHTARALLIVAAAGAVTRRGHAPLLIWALGTMAVLLALGAHAPSDILGGAVLASVLILAVEGAAAFSSDGCSETPASQPARGGLGRSFDAR